MLKKLVVALVLVATLSIGIGALSQTSKTAYARPAIPQIANATTGVNLRASASSTGTILGLVHVGDRVQILGHSGTWTNVLMQSGQNRNVVGWVHSDFIRENTLPDTFSPNVPQNNPNASAMPFANFRPTRSGVHRMTVNSLIGMTDVNLGVTINGQNSFRMHVRPGQFFEFNVPASYVNNRRCIPMRASSDHNGGIMNITIR